MRPHFYFPPDNKILCALKFLGLLGGVHLFLFSSGSEGTQVRGKLRSKPLSVCDCHKAQSRPLALLKTLAPLHLLSVLKGKG